MGDLLPNELPEQGTLRVDVEGASPSLWAKLRPKLIEAVNKLLDATIDGSRGTTIREEAKQFTSALLDHARARLAKAGLEADKVEAEVAGIYAKLEVDKAQARKVNAEADALEINNAIRRLKLALSMTRVVVVGDPSEEAIIFGKQIDAFLAALKELAAENVQPTGAGEGGPPKLPA